MSDSTRPRDDDRRLDLEQQKKLAKELRGAIARGEPAAVTRVLRHHPAAGDLPPAEVPARFARLSDAQLVLARELGLPSWPRLKAHIERLARARRAIAAQAPAPDGERSTLHIRCGSDIRARLAEAGFVGDFLEFSDPLCHGPVPRAGDYLAVRARFIAQSYSIPDAEVDAKLAHEYGGLARAAERHRRIVLWFEHDSYDQLCLARVLAELADKSPLPRLELICIDRFPAITRFRGLGQLSPAALRSLWDERAAVTAAQIRLGVAVWNALREPSPLALHALAAGGTPELPIMAGALMRHLQELPWSGDGLSLTQRLALAPLRERPRTIAQLFSILQMESEPLPYLGDLMLWSILREMQRAAPPPFAVDADTARQRWPQHLLSLTPTGAALLAGELDWMSLRPPDRWVGGVRIGAGAPPWRWQAARTQPVPG